MQEQQCLYHFPICPFCRKIRFILSANNVENCYFRIENFWEKREKFISINLSGEVPFLAVQRVEEDETKINTVGDIIKLVYERKKEEKKKKKKYENETVQDNIKQLFEYSSYF